MVKSPSHFSVILGFACLALLGMFFIPRLSFKLNPSRKQPVVNVRFTMWGQSPRIVEMEVTSKLESMLNRVRGVESLQSFSRQGAGGVTVRLSEHVDAEMVRFEISTIIRQAWPSMPEGVAYPSIEMSGVSQEVNRPFLEYTINAPYSPAEIQRYVNDHVRDKLEVLKGISSVSVYGAGQYVYKLQYDYPNLQQHQVEVEDIRRAINSCLGDEFLGLSDMGANERKRYIRVCLAPEKMDQKFNPSAINVVNKSGTLVRLDQLVTVSYEEEENSSSYRINGMNSIFLSITADEATNRLALSQSVQELLEQITPSLPPGYEFHKSYGESEYLAKELRKIYLRSGLTLLILLLFVFVVYRNLKHSMVIVIALACNLCIAAILYYLLHIEIHMFSLAGLTISITLMVDNFIIMSDQIVRQRNRSVFLAMLTAALTTLGALSIIFFLEENVKLNLLDFALVVVLNLSLSLFSALLLVPALIARFNLTLEQRHRPRRRHLFFRINRKRMQVRFNRVYLRVILFCRGRKARIAIVSLVVLIFGFPVFLLPDRLGVASNSLGGEQKVSEKKYESLYNKTFGSSFYKEHVKPVTDVLFGGTMRLFAQKVKNGSCFSGERGETMLFVNASLPNGSTKKQMDALVKKMEQYISSYKKVKQFETSVESGQRANIRILFTDEYQRGAFPYMLYSKLISKALELGGGSWSVSGVGDGYNNDVKEQAGSSRIKLLGYNYDMLSTLALQMRDSLLQHRRIKEVTIASDFSWYKDDYSEFVLEIDRGKLSETDMSPVDLYGGLVPIFQRSLFSGTWMEKGKSIPVILSSRQANELDVWNLEHYPGKISQADFHLSELANLQKSQAPQEISKENQQYRLCLQYEYIGSYKQAENVIKRQIESFNASAPLGYKAESESFKPWWEQGNTSQYGLLFLIFAIIFFSTGTLFNSISSPLIVLSIIPVSFIGIFLTFYFFDISFDQGGFAAFFLLSGLSINATIYMMDEYNRILKRQPNLSPPKAYIKAWNAKITPISLTVVSTIIGFIPFMVGQWKEAFWFPLAAGTSGGLVAGFIALSFFLPMFLRGAKK